MQVKNHTTVSESLDMRIRSLLEDEVYTCLPATILSTEDFQKDQTVSVRTLIPRLFDDGQALKGPEIFQVPVIFPSAGGGLLSFPIEVGDTVLLMFSKRSIEEWVLGDGREAAPQRNRQFSLSDAMAIPGLYTINSNLNPNPNDVEIKFKDQSVRLEAGGNIVISPASSKTMTFKPNGEVEHHSGAKITDSGDFVTASGISLDNHVHSGVQTGGSNTGTPV